MELATSVILHKVAIDYTVLSSILYCIHINIMYCTVYKENPCRK